MSTFQQTLNVQYLIEWTGRGAKNLSSFSSSDFSSLDLSVQGYNEEEGILLKSDVAITVKGLNIESWSLLPTIRMRAHDNRLVTG